MNEETNICQYQKFAIKRTTKTTYKISVLQNIILVCFDIVLLWIIMLIETCDNHFYKDDIRSLFSFFELNVDFMPQKYYPRIGFSDSQSIRMMLHLKKRGGLNLNL